MNFNKHSAFEGLHAFLGASNSHWLNYDKNKLTDVFRNMKAKQKGTELHAFAAEAIKLRIRLASSKRTINRYVNDAIGYKMTPEQVLFYSTNCFGTADAISFRDNFLRIHDLKTGVTPVRMEQLMIYAALFCLEYHYSPFDIKMELRIYQNNEVQIYEPGAEEISEIMELIKEFDKVLVNLNNQEE